MRLLFRMILFINYIDTVFLKKTFNFGFIYIYKMYICSQRSRVPIPQFPPLVTSCRSYGQYHS